MVTPRREKIVNTPDTICKHNPFLSRPSFRPLKQQISTDAAPPPARSETKRRFADDQGAFVTCGMQAAVQENATDV